jgi:hypothetical protein
MSVNRWKVVRSFTKLFYISGLVFLIAGMMLSLVNTPALGQDKAPGVYFLKSDQLFCQFEAGWVTATVYASLPEGMSAILQGQWYIVNPPSLATEAVYTEKVVQDGGSLDIEAWWPGIDPNYEDIVEIHWGGNLLDIEHRKSTRGSSCKPRLLCLC